jgi:hypothetical protein
MRQRLQRLLSIALIALAVQILAPIAASWAAASAASDPLQTAAICHGIPDPSSSRGDRGVDRALHEGTCLICGALQVSGPVDTPQQTALVAPYRQITKVTWTTASADASVSRTGSNAQARAPPRPV